MIIPYKADVAMDRPPYTNYLMMVSTAVAFAFQVYATDKAVLSFVLDGWYLPGLVGYMWLHGGYLHIIGNLIFMWVFGNAVCAKVGDGFYPVIYIVLGVAAGIVHLIVEGNPLLGASGAIFGLVGMYLMIYPLNDIKCMVLIIVPIAWFRVAGIWVISWWVIFNFCGQFFNEHSMTSYAAHLGGFFTGLIIGGVLIKLKLITREDTAKVIARSMGN